MTSENEIGELVQHWSIRTDISRRYIDIYMVYKGQTIHQLMKQQYMSALSDQLIRLLSKYNLFISIQESLPGRYGQAL